MTYHCTYIGLATSLLLVITNAENVDHSDGVANARFGDQRTMTSLSHLNECCNEWCQQDEILGRWVGRQLDPPVPIGYNPMEDKDSCNRCGCSMVYENADKFYSLGGHKKCEATNFDEGTCDCEAMKGSQLGVAGNSILHGMEYCRKKFGTVTEVYGSYSASSCICGAEVEGGDVGVVRKTVWRSPCMEDTQAAQFGISGVTCPKVEAVALKNQNQGEMKHEKQTNSIGGGKRTEGGRLNEETKQSQSPKNDLIKARGQNQKKLISIITPKQQIGKPKVNTVQHMQEWREQVQKAKGIHMAKNQLRGGITQNDPNSSD